MIYSEDTKARAKTLYLKRWKVPEIARELGIKSTRIIYIWIKRNNWKDLVQDEAVVTQIDRRLAVLIDSPAKSDAEYREIDLLIKARGNLLKQASTSRENTRSSNASGSSKPSSKPQRKGKKNNDISGITAEDIEKHFVGQLFGYQKELREAKNNPKTCRMRQILKSRQIGATYYFAGEAFEDAILNGDDQIFLSASKAQSGVFREYIKIFASEWFGLELQGTDKIELTKDGKPWATLRYLSTNSRTAQSYHGHVYVDEYFWIPKFEVFNKVAAAMATHKKWRKTYFSTPSTVEHQAYPLWSGDKYNAEQKKPVEFPSFKQMQKGVVCPDGCWRKIITIHDAEKGGCNLFDIDILRQENPGDEFKNLYECIFIDCRMAVFRLADLEHCLVDTSKWRDYKPRNSRPFGNKEVWIGYDPSRTRDDATCVVLAPPEKENGSFRILEKYNWRGQNFTYQANRIKELTQRFNVQHIGIDTTGIGSGVFDLVQQFFPNAYGIHYSIENKTNLVLKGQNIVQNQRLKWDTQHTDIGHAFLTIKRATTNGGQVTYVANRTEKTGHGDLVWAVLHALINEPLAGAQRKSTWG